MLAQRSCNRALPLVVLKLMAPSLADENYTLQQGITACGIETESSAPVSTSILAALQLGNTACGIETGQLPILSIQLFLFVATG